MDIKLLFDPIPDLGLQKTAPLSLGASIQIHQDKLPDINNMDLVIIGLTDGSDKSESSKIDQAANKVRKKLYELQKGASTYRVADLGNLRAGHDLDETKGRLSELIASMIEKGILPIILGGTHDFDYAQYQAYEMSEKLISFLNVDAFIDINEEKAGSHQSSHIHKILMHEPNYLFNYTHLAHQTYLVPYTAIDVLEKLYFNTIRLGKLRDNFKEAEPYIREADLLSFDVCAIQSQYMKAVQNPQVFGLTGEEACRIAWYAGSSERLSSAGFYGYDPAKDDENGTGAVVLATMLWYFIEGYYNRRDKQEFTTKHYIKYVVSMDHTTTENIVFYKSNQSEKWWMEVPAPTPKSLYNRPHVVPCSYDDYKKAVAGEIPQRWINNYTKLN